MRLSVARLSAAILGVVAAVQLFAPADAAAEVRLVLSHHVPPSHVINATAERFAQTVKQKTNGEVIIDIKPNAQLFGMEAAVEALNLGTLDLAWGNLSALQKWAPALGFASMPFLFKDGDQAKRVFYGPAGQTIHDDVLAAADVDILAYGDAGFRIFVSKKPIHTAADAAGKKLRVPNIAAFVDMVKALKANPVPLSATEIYTALQTGVIDGMESPADYFVGAKIWEVTSDASVTNHVFTAGALMASAAAMGRLTPAQQKIVRDAAVEAVGGWMWSQVEDGQAAAIAELGKHMKVDAQPDTDSFRKATAGMIDAFVAATGEPAGKYVKAVRDAGK
jgi:tripartite ATP-independent transporter DctP family solute receptor